MTKVDITTAGHTVIVEAPDRTDLDAVAAKALELWQATRDPALTRGYGATGFTGERSSATEYVTEHDVLLRASRAAT